MEHFLHAVFAIPYQVFGHPFTIKWVHSMRLYLFCDKKSPHFILWRLNYFLNFSYLITLIGLMITHINVYTSSNNYVGVVFHGLWMVATTSMVMPQASFFLLGDDVVNLVGKNVDLIQHFERELSIFGNDAFRKSEKVRKWLLGGFGAASFAVQVVILIPISLMFQHEVWQLGSHFSRFILWIAPNQKLIAATVGVLVDQWHLTVIQGPNLLVVHISTSFMHTFKTSVEKILQRQLKSTSTGVSKSLQCLQEDMQIYSKLRILTTLYNGIFGAIYVFPFKVMMAFFLVLIATITATVAGQGGHLFILFFGAVCTTVGTIFLVIFTAFMAMVNEYSAKLLKNLKMRRECQATPVGRRLIQSFKVEAVRSSSFYAIRRISCLTLLAFIANLTGSVLITL